MGLDSYLNISAWVVENYDDQSSLYHTYFFRSSNYFESILEIFYDL